MVLPVFLAGPFAIFACGKHEMDWAMDFIEASLIRIRAANRQFVSSPNLLDACALESQIELRRRVLKDIDAIRCRLRPPACYNGRRPGPKVGARRGITTRAKPGMPAR